MGTDPLGKQFCRVLNSKACTVRPQLQCSPEQILHRPLFLESESGIVTLADMVARKPTEDYCGGMVNCGEEDVADIDASNKTYAIPHLCTQFTHSRVHTKQCQTSSPYRSMHQHRRRREWRHVAQVDGIKHRSAWICHAYEYLELRVTSECSDIWDVV
ncbi:hypothetical protein BC938DRAFT_472646 [Jimgerdemannia flammicorona]|uniref:Uncharacterized protein n=1 Tax=Jimgerdemannia flammicorona TaxID=994334 RepID=A0A433QTX7_9FUNG|nr:hypothetical protein BC938DRAFT_472646 [Jimgerdemannia flammicorona]